MVGWWVNKSHISWQFAAASAGIIIGVALVLVGPFLLSGWEWIVAGLALFTLAAIKQTRWALSLALVGGLICGFSLGSAKQQQLNQYDLFYGLDLELVGKIAEDPVSNSDGDKSFNLKNIAIGPHGLEGKIWVSAKTNLNLKRGDEVTLRGKLNEGFGNIPATVFRADVIKADRPVNGDIGRQVRDWFADGVRVAITEPAASLGIGYLIGQRTALPESLEEEFRLLGLSHLVVASGANLIIIVRLLRRGAMRISKFTATAASFGFIGLFLLITGFSTSMSRAALVASLSLLAWYYGRNIHPLVLVLLASAITLLVDPSFLWGDVGWYLSFAAFGGVVFLAPLINHYFWGDQEPGALRYIFVATVAAQIATFPIIALMFSQYSPLALLANLLVQPLVPIAMLLTFIAGVAGLAAPAIASFIGWPAELILSLTIKLTSWMSTSPFAVGKIEITGSTMVGMYALVTAAAFYLWRNTQHRFRQDNIVE
jgi:competence protein ComEC